MRQLLNTAWGTDVEAKGDLNKLHVKIVVNMSFRRMRHWVSRWCIKVQMLGKIQNKRQGMKKEIGQLYSMIFGPWGPLPELCVFIYYLFYFLFSLVWRLVLELQLVIWPQRRRERPCTRPETCWEARASITYLTRQMEPWPTLLKSCDLPIW